MTAVAARSQRVPGVARWVALLAVACMMLFAASPVDGTGSWPMFQGDELHSGLATGKDLPATLDKLWSMHLDGATKASPILVEGIIYIGTEAGNFYAVDGKSGKKLWGPVALAEPVLAPAAYENDKIYVATSSSDGATGKIYVLEAKSGKELMSVALDKGSHGGPTIQGGKIFVGTESGKLFAFETQGMNKLWEFSTALTIDSSLVPSDTNNPCCLRSSVAAKPIKTTPIAYKDRVYFGSFNHQFFAVESGGNPGTETTKLYWVENVHDIIYSSAAVDPAAERLVVGSYNGKLYSFDTRNYGFSSSCQNYTTARTYHAVGNDCSKTPHWRYDTGSRIYSSPAIAHGRAYFGDNDGKLHAVTLQSGQAKWTYQTGGGLFSSPAVINHTIVVGSYDGKVYMFKESDKGELLGDPFTYQLSEKVHASPAIVDGVVYIASQDGVLYALAAPGTEPGKPPAGFGTPDLKVNNMVLTPAVPRPGQLLEVAVTVANGGDGDAGPASVRLYRNDGLVAEKQVTLEAGKSQVVLFTFTPEPGDMALRATMDEAGAVAEEDTSNNEFSMSATAAPDEGEPSGGDDGNASSEEDAPGPALVVVLTLIGGVAVALRRRRAT